MSSVYEVQDQKNSTKASLREEQKSHPIHAAGYMSKVSPLDDSNVSSVYADYHFRGSDSSD